MRRTSSLLAGALGAGALVLSLVAAPGATASGTARADRATPHAAATTPAEQARVAAYWTPARMRSAIPREKTYVANKGKPGGGTSSATAVQVNPPNPKVGKVFFTEGGFNYVCSGTSTASSSGSLVLTAGHCVNEGPGAYVTNFAFVPGYLSGSTPYGTFPATSLLTTNEWKNSGDYNHDIGFATVARNASGVTLATAVGSYPMAFDSGYGIAVEAYGYPQARPYDGTSQWKCVGTAGTDTTGGSTDLRLPCTMTGGSSGGGWLSNVKGVTSLVSVNSFGYRGEKDVMYGPYFGSVEQSLYTQVD